MTDFKSILDLEENIYGLRQGMTLLSLVHMAYVEGLSVIPEGEMSDALFCISKLLRENVLGLEAGFEQLAERQKGVAKV